MTLIAALNEKALREHKPPRLKLLCDPFEAIEEVGGRGGFRLHLRPPGLFAFGV